MLGVRNLRHAESLASFGCVGAGLTFSLGDDILVDALCNAGIAIGLAIPSTDGTVCQGAVAVIDCRIGKCVRKLIRDTKTGIKYFQAE